MSIRYAAIAVIARRKLDYSDRPGEDIDTPKMVEHIFISAQARYKLD